MKTDIQYPKRQPPTQPSTLFAWLKWAFLGNVDDGFYGDTSFNSEGKTDRWTAIKWWFRNPAHNFCFYVIGVADQTRYVTGPWGAAHDRLEVGETGWMWSYTKVVHSLPLPYVNFSNKWIKFYAGWRPQGAFGFKLKRA